jgi:hypothetical protein
MENDPNYLAAVHRGARIDKPFGREQSLSWYFLPDHQLDNVTGITTALKRAEIIQLATGTQTHRLASTHARQGLRSNRTRFKSRCAARRRRSNRNSASRSASTTRRPQKPFSLATSSCYPTVR